MSDPTIEGSEYLSLTVKAECPTCSHKVFRVADIMFPPKGTLILSACCRRGHRFEVRLDIDVHLQAVACPPETP
jgi:hypothetical protein